MAASESFSLGLANYCLCAMVFPRFSLAGLIGVEITWFVLWVFTPAMLHPSAPRDEIADPGVRSFEIPESEPVLTVTLPGRAILLRQQSVAQSVFAAADQNLIGIAFGRRRNLELLRRAVWLGSCRSDSYTLSEFAALLDETARTESVIDACLEVNRRERLPLRLRLWFFGDFR